jgi:hypothetical protein
MKTREEELEFDTLLFTLASLIGLGFCVLINIIRADIKAIKRGK